MIIIEKKWFKSRTLWFNVFVAAMLLAEQNITSLQGLLPDSFYKLAVFLVPMINMLLRVATTKGLSFTPKMPDSIGS